MVDLSTTYGPSQNQVINQQDNVIHRKSSEDERLHRQHSHEEDPFFYNLDLSNYQDSLETDRHLAPVSGILD